MVYYDKKVIYLSEMEYGNRIKGAGFARMECRGESCSFDVHVSGMKMLAEKKYDLAVVSVWGKEYFIGRIFLHNGSGEWKGVYADGKVGAYKGENIGGQEKGNEGRDETSEDRIFYREIAEILVRISDTKVLMGKMPFQEKAVRAAEITAAGEIAMETDTEGKRKEEKGIWKFVRGGKTRTDGMEESTRREGIRANEQWGGMECIKGGGEFIGNVQVREGRQTKRDGQIRENERKRGEESGKESEWLIGGGKIGGNQYANEKELMKGDRRSGGDRQAGEKGQAGENRQAGEKRQTGENGQAGRNRQARENGQAGGNRYGAENWQGGENGQGVEIRQAGKNRQVRENRQSKGNEIAEGNWQSEEISRIGADRKGRESGQVREKPYLDKDTEISWGNGSGETESKSGIWKAGYRMQEDGRQESRGKKEEERIQIDDVILNDKWDQLKQLYSVVHPYEDDRQYIAIQPKDFVIMTGDYQHLANNSFLLHGFYNYRHIVLGRERDGNFYLGVPGVYYEREKMVALMFGFEAFECKGGRAEAGKFGYYLRKVKI